MSSKITSNDIRLAYQEVQQRRIEYAKDNILAFARYTMPTFHASDFHKKYYSVLNEFIKGNIKKLIISCPPQHGKSLGSSINVPAMMVGKNPDLKVATVCYSATKARKFGRKTKQLMMDKPYKEIYGSRLAERTDTAFVNTAEEMEMVDHDGSLKMVGYHGGLTGDAVDVLIMDDLYKDWQEANSPTIRDNVIDWYVTVADTRLHNKSQQLIVFTRWHEEDLVGFIESTDTVVDITSLEDIADAPDDCWFKINFEAIKTNNQSDIDPREDGEPLWPERHSIDRLNKARAFDPIKFDALYQGDPQSKEGFLYGDFLTYKELPDNITIRKSYTDTADMGDDHLCSVVYDQSSTGLAYVIDVLYTQDAMEITEPKTANMMKINSVRQVRVESNNGGRGFARKVNELTPSSCSISWFTQSKNKEARIISNSATVTEKIVMPADWHMRWPKFYKDVVKYKRLFKSNKYDDAPDTLTGIAETLVTGEIYFG